MAVQNYPSSSSLMITFLEDVKRYRANRISGMNPTLINFNGEQIYIYIRNLSPAQLSNDNPDIWRIQLPKREEFETIKKSDKLFFLFGYDYVRKVYTTWNPYWCKQRLNVAESCSMYSRFSLQKRVADTQKTEVMQLQNEGNVVCIPSFLLGNYIKNYKEYYPEETTYVAVGSSIQKRINDETQNDMLNNKSFEQALFDKFKECYNIVEFKTFLTKRELNENDIVNYIERLRFVFEEGYIVKHSNLFLECLSLKDYIRAINRFCYQPDIKSYEESWGKAILFALRYYLVYVEKKLYGKETIRIPSQDFNSTTKNKDLNEEDKQGVKKENSPKYELDIFGKLKSLDSTIIELLLPMIRGIDFPDYNEMIKEVRNYYPEIATEKMTPADWMNLFDNTKWQKRRGRKSSLQKKSNSIKKNDEDNIGGDTIFQDEVLPIIVESKSSSTEIAVPKIPIDTNKLMTVFDKKVTSYKYFWFIAILGLAKNKRKRSIPFSDILIRIVALAWPIVLEDEIELADFDMMPKYLKDIQKKTYLIKSASSKVVESSLSDYFHSGIADILKPLLNNVPYRFLSPWIKFTNNSEVIAKSKDDLLKCPYAIYSDCIVLDEDWFEYFNSHYEQLCDYTLKSFIEYTRQFNNNLKLIKLMSTGWSLK